MYRQPSHLASKIDRLITYVIQKIIELMNKPKYQLPFHFVAVRRDIELC
jgi:hypothetical protein